MEKVFFGARMTGYTGRDELNRIGDEGVLVLYEYMDAKGECRAFFYFDQGPSVGWVLHSRSRYSIVDGKLTAVSVRSGTVKEYDVSRATETGPEVFDAEKGSLDAVPEGWLEVFLSICGDHAWRGEPVVDTQG